MLFKCDICEWIYDEDTEGTPFEELPNDYRCPACGAGKEMFSKVTE